MMWKKIMSKVSNLALVMFVATAVESVTFGCAWILYQPEEPKKLRVYGDKTSGKLDGDVK